jgi:hypothetical protein
VKSYRKLVATIKSDIASEAIRVHVEFDSDRHRGFWVVAQHIETVQGNTRPKTNGVRVAYYITESSRPPNRTRLLIAHDLAMYQLSERCGEAWDAVVMVADACGIELPSILHHVA